MNPSYNYSLSKILSPSFFKTLIEDDKKKLSNISLQLCESGILSRKDVTFRTALARCFNYLSQNHRTEYVFKNLIISKLILENHDLSECSIISELRVGNSKADLAVFNGTSTVYEIKTELDTLERLPSQINDYLKFFEFVNVVTTESHLKKLVDVIPTNVGIILLDDDNSVRAYRPAISNIENLCHETLYLSLRKYEYFSIVEKEFGSIPDLPNTQIYKACFDLFSTIPLEKAHKYIVSELLKRGVKPHQINASLKNPDELLTMWLSHNYSQKQCEKIVAGLRSKLPLN